MANAVTQEQAYTLCAHILGKCVCVCGPDKPCIEGTKYPQQR